MTRLQTLLLAVLLVLGSVLLGRIAWDALAPVAASGAAVAVHALRSAPEAVWWVAFSAIWWLPCVLGKRACHRSSCSAPAAA